jgi:alkylation response protein AidB-like acyl-CoA dehydrogenase
MGCILRKVCGASAFMMWCQTVCGLYMQTSGNPALTNERLQRHVQGLELGGTGLSNPMKSLAQTENLLRKATPLEGGSYRVNGTLPWISNLAGDHYLGAIAAVMDGDQSAGREVMFILKCDAPGVTLRACPKFSGMEGTGTYAVQCKDLLITSADIVADPARPYIRKIRVAFVRLQCGIAAGIVQGAIDSICAVESQLGHVNQYLDDRPEDLQAELDDLVGRVMTMAETPYKTSTEFFIDVPNAHTEGAELCLRASQSALMDQGARSPICSHRDTSHQAPAQGNRQS